MSEGNFREAGVFPGADPRQWCSFGVVQDDPSGTEHSVRFNDDEGQPLPHGVLVDVKLEPSGVIVPCRVAMRTAGSGEAEWDPIGPGDEVFVGIAEGDERAGCVILGRLNNKKDVFPTLAAGQDVTMNNMVVRRYAAPYVLESGHAIQIRNALTGSQLVLDDTGGAILGSSDKHSLVMTSVGVILGLGSGDASLQLDPEKSTASIQAKGTSLLLDDSDSRFQTGGTMTFQTSGGGGQGHAVTLEQVVGLLACYTAALGTALQMCSPAVNLTAPPTNILASPANFDTFMSTIVHGAGGSLVPCTPSTPGGNFAAFPLTFLAPLPGGAIAAAMAASGLFSAVDVTGTIPGVGRAGFRL